MYPLPDLCDMQPMSAAAPMGGLQACNVISLGDKDDGYCHQVRPRPLAAGVFRDPQLVILMVWKIGIKFLSSLSLEDEEVRAAIVRLWAAEADCVDAKNNPEVH